MKDIIEVAIVAKKGDISIVSSDLLVVGYFSDSKELSKCCKELDAKLGGAIGKLIELGDFKGKTKSTVVVYGNDDIGAKRVMIVGLGEKGKAKLGTLRDAAAVAANKAVGMNVDNMAVALHEALGGKFDLAAMGQVIAEGVYFGSYRYDEYMTSDDDDRGGSLNAELIESDSSKLKKLKHGMSVGTIIGAAQSYARTIANRPGNVINPPVLADEAKRMVKATAGLSCTVWDEKQMVGKKMGGVLAVGSGSKMPPRFIVIRYESKSPKAKKLPTVGLVGKAITFDSGGISIKPAANMDQMKLDKCGGVAVLATMKAVAELRLPVNVYGIIPSAENMPGGSSWRPGDIVTTYSGKTVEIQNTDAEGRMILCDGIHYAAEQGCDVIIDIATLTGACMVALGKYKAGLMSNDDKLVKALQKAALQSGNAVWHLPSGDEYTEEMKSKIADLKNIGSRWGGASTAASFLREFAGNKTWAHVDMAGMDVFEKPGNGGAVGASGYGVRLFVAYLMNLVGK